jgi:hypothetical protein
LEKVGDLAHAVGAMVHIPQLLVDRKPFLPQAASDQGLIGQAFADRAELLSRVTAIARGILGFRT